MKRHTYVRSLPRCPLRLRSAACPYSSSVECEDDGVTDGMKWYEVNHLNLSKCRLP